MMFKVGDEVICPSWNNATGIVKKITKKWSDEVDSDLEIWCSPWRSPDGRVVSINGYIFAKDLEIIGKPECEDWS